MHVRTNKSSSAYIVKKLKIERAVMPAFHQNEITYDRNAQGQLCTLGGGAYATVYKATWQGKAVAVKKMHRAPDMEAICKNEQRIMAILAASQSKQPNLHVINCYAYKKSPHNYYLILDYAPNGTVAEYLNKFTNISLRHYQIAIDTAKGLDYLHNVCKIVHSDMKPSNLLLDAKMNVVISDYGFSIKRKRTKILLQGTPYYVAPELYLSKGKITPYSPASDVYAYGVILYDIFVGEEPYPSEWCGHEILRKIGRGERPTIPQTCPVKDLIPKCWNQDPFKRPSDKELILETENYYRLAKSNPIQIK